MSGAPPLYSEARAGRIAQHPPRDALHGLERASGPGVSPVEDELGLALAAARQLLCGQLGGQRADLACVAHRNGCQRLELRLGHVEHDDD